MASNPILDQGPRMVGGGLETAIMARADYELKAISNEISQRIAEKYAKLARDEAYTEIRRATADILSRLAIAIHKDMRDVKIHVTMDLPPPKEPK